MNFNQPIFWVNLVAILVGPILAVIVARLLEAEKLRRDRRAAVFTTLMRTRRTPMVPDHVGALNMVEIEFASDSDVIDRWRELFKHFGTEHPRNRDEQESSTQSSEEVDKRRAAFGQRIAQERQRLLAKLLHAMGKRLGYKAEQLEIFEGGYTPQGWVDDEIDGRAARAFLVDIALGRKVLPIGIFYDSRPQPSPPTDV
jgi:hypothetical protein